MANCHRTKLFNQRNHTFTSQHYIHVYQQTKHNMNSLGTRARIAARTRRSAPPLCCCRWVCVRACARLHTVVSFSLFFSSYFRCSGGSGVRTCDTAGACERTNPSDHCGAHTKGICARWRVFVCVCAGMPQRKKYVYGGIIHTLRPIRAYFMCV